MKNNDNFTFIDLFSGIGGFRIALESLGGVCIASSEIDAAAITVYRSNWPNDDPNHNLGDITQLQELPKHELLVGGVPCQPWSIAGNNRAFSDPRGQLWGDVIRLVEINRPKAFIFENVKGLKDQRHNDCFKIILSAFKDAGYTVKAKLLNAFDYGVPQNRDRVFIVGIRKDLRNDEYMFPEYHECSLRLFQVFDNLVSPENGVTEVPIQRNKLGERHSMGFNKLTPKGQHNKFFIINDIRNGPTSIHSWEMTETTSHEKQICMTLLRNRRNKKYGPCDGNPMSFDSLKELLPDLQIHELNILIDKGILRQYEDERFEFKHRRLSGGINGTYRIFLPDSKFFGTITATGMKDKVAEVCVTGDSSDEYRNNFIEQVFLPGRYRSISDREAARLQAFPESFILHQNMKVSLKLLGNSVAIPVVLNVAKSLAQTGALNYSSDLQKAT